MKSSSYLFFKCIIPNSPHPQSCQKQTIVPYPTLNQIYLKSSPPMLNVLPKAHTMRKPINIRAPPTRAPPTPTLTISMFQIYHFSAFRHRESVSTVYRHNHFTREVWLKVHNFLIPEHPCWIGLQMEFQLTKWNLNSSPIPPHKFFIKIFSITFATPAGKGKGKMK